LTGSLVLVILIAVVWWIASIAWKGSTQLIYPPHRLPTATPADFDLESEPISFKSHDGIILRGWFIPAPDSVRAIILCHGYSGDCSPDLVYAPLLHTAGYHLLFFDFRGHGASDGTCTSLVSFERADLLAALAHLWSRGITRVGLLGFSMGGAIALASASLSPLVVGVISDCAFAELWHIPRQVARRRGLPEPFAAAVGWCVVLFASMRLRANLSSADPVRWIDKIAPRPVLIMHGIADADAPVAEAYQLFRVAREPKELWLVPGATHRKIEEIACEEYRKRVIEFFERSLY
jgi:fermentation-respiration switch protein FrsA (DUF1100 family)